MRKLLQKKVLRNYHPYKPKQKNKAEFFIAVFNYWSVRLLDRTYDIVKDNRFNGHMIVDYDYDTKKVVVKYNSRKLSRWSYSFIIEGVFHEIGHIMQGSLPYETEEQKIFAEYDAESYALRMMKKYYSKQDLQEVMSFQAKQLKKLRFRKKYPIHYEAFRQIKEYQ